MKSPILLFQGSKVKMPALLLVYVEKILNYIYPVLFFENQGWNSKDILNPRKIPRVFYSMILVSRCNWKGAAYVYVPHHCNSSTSKL